MREQDIIQLLQSRDETGIEALLRHYGPLMRYVIAPILSNPQDREECLSEVALRIWEKIDLYDSERGSWNGWLTALTRNTALNRARQLRSMDRADISPDLPTPAPTPEEALLRQEREAALTQALNQLPDKDRLLFYRKYYYLQSTAQIASELGMTRRAVEGKLYRLKKRLRTLLGGDAHDDA